MQQTITQIGNFSYYPNSIIGKGATGCVYLGFQNKTKFNIAVKVIKLLDINTNVKKHLLNCQINALAHVKSNWVCQTYDILKDQQFYFIPMQLIPNGTLRTYIKNKGKLSQNQALHMFSKILSGYLAIKNTGYIHRDLKSENILLRYNMEPVIIDFGYAQKISTSGQKMSYNVGSPAYMSPQAYNQNQYSQKSDIWALGIVFHQMLTGTIPIMRTADVDQYFRYLKNMKTAQIIRGQQNQLCTRLLLHALAVDTRLRYNTQQLLQQLNNPKPNSNVTNPSVVKKMHSYHYTNSPSSFHNPSPPPPLTPLKKVNSQNQVIENLKTSLPQNNNSNNQICNQTPRKTGSRSQWLGTPLFTPTQNLKKPIKQYPTSPTQTSSTAKRSPLNNINFNLNVQPVRFNPTDSNPLPLHPAQIKKQPMTPTVIFKKPQIPQLPKLKKAFSFNPITSSQPYN